ncbi:hypothetical protein JHK86_024385 [Glycine max]|nr:hypothetical protein JHK86_024385 [Glycine max]
MSWSTTLTTARPCLWGINSVVLAATDDDDDATVEVESNQVLELSDVIVQRATKRKRELTNKRKIKGVRDAREATRWATWRARSNTMGNAVVARCVRISTVGKGVRDNVNNSERARGRMRVAVPQGGE